MKYVFVIYLSLNVACHSGGKQSSNTPVPESGGDPTIEIVDGKKSFFMKDALFADLESCKVNSTDLESMKSMEACGSKNQINIFEDIDTRSMILMVERCGLKLNQIVDFLCYRRLR